MYGKNFKAKRNSSDEYHGGTVAKRLGESLPYPSAIANNRTGEQIMEQYAELIAALKKAREKATAAGLLSDDGGTYNFDSPVLYMPKGTRETTMDKIGLCAGVSFMKWESRPFAGADRSAWLIFGDFMSGQGNRRSRSTEAFAASLKADGFESDTYYQMD